MSEAKTTTNHEEIRKWAEARKGRPATVKSTADEEPGILRIDFPGYSGEETLQSISWDEFFDKFDREHLAFLYQEETPEGNVSRFCKFISQESA